MIRPARRGDSSQDKSPSNGLDGGPDSLRLLQVVGKSRSSGVSDSRKLLSGAMVPGLLRVDYLGGQVGALNL